LALSSALRVVSTALNLPGPVACARLRDLGASVTKIEPPDGDPLALYCPQWYSRLHEDVHVHRLDLKGAGGRATMAGLLDDADVLVTAQRPAALARMGLDAVLVAHPRLCHVAIVGHAPPDEDTPGHDLTYLAANGLVAPPELPRTLFADMAGGERVATEALALVIAREGSRRGGGATVALADVARDLARPLREGLTGPGAMLGGGLAGYNLYATSDGWIAVAALEPHFLQGLGAALDLEPTREHLEARFRERTAHEWEQWARKRDLPIIEVRPPFRKEATP
jgi:alpha-methylacyl-CoA racemase